MLSNPEFRTTFRRWGIVFLLLVVMAVLVFSIILAGDWISTFTASEVVPISINSDLIANYQPDTFSGEVAALSLEIIEDVIFDQQLDDQSAAVQLEEIVDELKTPVPTVTPAPTMTPTPLSEQTGTAQVSSTPTTILPGPTQDLTNTPVASSTATVQPSDTPHPGATFTPTTNATATPTQATSQPPSSTPGPTFLPTLVPTSTFTPTFTPTPTSIPINTPTPTHTATQPADSCGLVELSSFIVKKDEVSWTITNYSSQTILLTGTYINWPSANAQLKKVKLDRRTIWDQKDDTPPTYIFLSWKGRESMREIRAGDSEVILFEFDKNAAAYGYFLELTFNYNDSCKISITN